MPHIIIYSPLLFVIFNLFLPIQESQDERNLVLPLIAQSHRLLFVISRMTFGEATEYFINTNIPLRFIEGIHKIKHSCLIAGMKRLWMFRQPKIELTFALFVHKLNITFYSLGYTLLIHNFTISRSIPIFYLQRRYIHFCNHTSRIGLTQNYGYTVLVLPIYN